MKENKVDLGAPLLDYSAQVEVVPDTGVDEPATNTTCVFKNFTNYTLK